MQTHLRVFSWVGLFGLSLTTVGLSLEDKVPAKSLLNCKDNYPTVIEKNSKGEVGLEFIPCADDAGKVYDLRVILKNLWSDLAMKIAAEHYIDEQGQDVNNQLLSIGSLSCRDRIEFKENEKDYFFPAHCTVYVITKYAPSLERLVRLPNYPDMIVNPAYQGLPLIPGDPDQFLPNPKQGLNPIIEDFKKLNLPTEDNGYYILSEPRCGIDGVGMVECSFTKGNAHFLDNPKKPVSKAIGGYL